MIAKLALMIVGLIALTLGLTVLLDYAKFERAFSELAESRFAFVVKELRSTVETGLNLGLSLANMKNLEPVIERERQRDDHIVSITLFDRERILIHSAKNHAAESPLDIAALWRRSLATSADGYWRGETPSAWQVGASLTDNAGQQTGGIVLQYDHALYDRDLNQMLADLARAAAILGLVTMPLGFVSLFALFHRTRGSLARIRSALERLSAGSSAAGFQPRADAALERHYAAAEQKIQAVLTALDSEPDPPQPARAEPGRHR